MLFVQTGCYVICGTRLSSSLRSKHVLCAKRQFEYRLIGWDGSVQAGAVCARRFSPSREFLCELVMTIGWRIKVKGEIGGCLRQLPLVAGSVFADGGAARGESRTGESRTAESRTAISPGQRQRSASGVVHGWMSGRGAAGLAAGLEVVARCRLSMAAAI